MKVRRPIKIKKNTFFKSSTFASKLFLKLASSSINPVISCVSILKFEPQNRSRKDIEKTIPWLSTLDDLTTFLLLDEKPSDYHNIMIEFGLILFYQYAKQHHIVKRLGEKHNFFYLVMNGSLAQLEVEYSKESLSDEDYLIHLIKLSILNENELANKIISNNADIFPINDNNIEHFCNNSTHYDYHLLYRKAEQILEKYHLSSINKKGIHNVSSIADYIKMTAVEIDSERSNNGNKTFNERMKTKKKYYTIPHFVQTGILRTGSYFGDLLLNQKDQNECVYISTEHSDLGYINKNVVNHISNIFLIISKKMKRIFKEKQQLYYIFRNIPQNTFLNTYTKMISFKRFKKGEKLFTQETEYKGVFLLQKGSIEIFTNRVYDELDGLMVSLQHSLMCFNEYISTLKESDIPLENVSTLFHNPIYKSYEFINASKNKKKVPITTLNNSEVIGLNEYYNNKTHIYNFSAECVSDEAYVYFIPKEAFTFIINKETTVKTAIIQLVELKVQLFVQAIRRYKNNFVQEIGNTIGCKAPKFENLFPQKPKQKKNLIRLTLLQSPSSLRLSSNNRKVSSDKKVHLNLTSIPRMSTNTLETSATLTNIIDSMYLKTSTNCDSQRTINKKRTTLAVKDKTLFPLINTNQGNSHPIRVLPPLKQTYKSSKNLPLHKDLFKM